jgi:hypothetical protein
LFARLVKIGDFSIWVTCSPSTPLSEVLIKAAREMERVEKMRLIEHCAEMGRLWSTISK